MQTNKVEQQELTIIIDFNIDLLKDNEEKVEQQQLPWWEILMLTC